MPSQFQLRKALSFISSGSLLRILIVWLICLVSLRLDSLTDFDLRFQIRGDRSPAKDIVIIELNPSDLRHFNTSEVQDLMLLNSSSNISDSYYWNPQLWNSLLFELLKLQPKVIVVTLDLLRQAFTENLNMGLLSNPKVSWIYSNDLDPLGLEKKRLLDVLNIEFEKDGVVRRILPNSRMGPAQYINFQGTENRFFKISYNQLISNEWPLDFFKNKVIILGGFTNTDYEYITPMGPYGRSALVAQLMENKVASQWIKSFGFWTQGLFLLLLISLIYFSTIYLPRNISITVSMTTLFLLLISNVYLFDIHYFWFPIVSSGLCVFLGWLSGYTVLTGNIEKTNFQLQKESETRTQLELMKSNFISLISHDLKNPLAKIQSVVARNLSTQPNGLLSQDLTAIQKYSEELDHYIRSILNIARVESKNIKLNRIPSDLNELIETSIASLRPLAADKNISIQTNLTPLFLINIDPILIKEALINIIENAIKYSPSHTVIEIRTLELGEQIITEVCDQGMGISETELGKMGQKFFRSELVPDSIKGTGLGFFLVKYFVELHAGNVEVSSSLNKGTTVRIKLPNS
ncbi:MAG: CHASE2 domain-containing protein [Bdellovibrionaceae bacterium]|nr:CHASE2 domain-containing protein [Pseudobdellovibrionaceae bacterium]